MAIEDNLNSEAKKINDARRAAEVKAAANTSTVTTESQATTASEPAPAQVSITGLEAEILNLINNIRVSHGLNALSPNQMLINIARTRSQDMISRGYFSHHTPEGQNIRNILDANGVYCQNVGENLVGVVGL